MNVHNEVINNSTDNQSDSNTQNDDPKIKLVQYNEKNFEEKTITNFDSLSDTFTSDRVHWVDIVGTKNFDLLKALGDELKLHPLVIEDINSTNQRLKVDYFPEYIFIVLKAINYIKGESVELEQVSIILGENFVISLQEFQPNIFEQVLDRIKNSRGRIRRFGADYLAYVLIDILVDNYFIIIEDLGERIDEMQDSLIQDPSPQSLQAIYDLKKEMIKIRKATWPLREIISQLNKIDTEFIKETTNIYLRDVYDHIIQIIDTIETYRDILSGMIDIFMSSVSNKMNEVMKVLTIIATIFIPLTFIAGVYGMNFQNMPELAWKWGYLTIICVMIAITIGMIFFFRRKKWI